MDGSREAYWAARLRPIRLGAEPVEVQVRLRLASTAVLSGVVALIGSILLAIFAGFGRPDVGAGVVGLFVVPVALWSWADYARLRRRAAAYLRERDGATAEAAPPG